MVADALLLKHHNNSAHIADRICIAFNQFHGKSLHSEQKILEIIAKITQFFQS